MTPAGPPLAVLTRRLLDTPADFQLPGTLPPPLPGAPPLPSTPGGVLASRQRSTAVPPPLPEAAGGPAAMQSAAAPARPPAASSAFAAPEAGAGSVEVNVRAVLADVLDSRSVPVDAALLDRLLPAGASRNQQALTLLIAWLLAEPALPLPADPAGYTQLASDLAALAPELPVERCLAEDERREELARLLLGAFSLVPAGESPTQARDRYTSVSTLEAVRLAGLSRAREQRAKEILAALARKAAEEAADKWSRE
ncbi:MAG: hypothetical protein MUE46_09090 [Xanthomonadales bacterium]|jgi:hypothetical protein|nr:hypothetical protein [Xanthomonadales bacterium]